jgi:hypothetical protein
MDRSGFRMSLILSNIGSYFRTATLSGFAKLRAPVATSDRLRRIGSQTSNWMQPRRARLVDDQDSGLHRALTASLVVQLMSARAPVQFATQQV